MSAVYGQPLLPDGAQRKLIPLSDRYWDTSFCSVRKPTETEPAGCPEWRTGSTLVL